MVSWTVNYKSMSIGVQKKRLSHVWCCINFGFGKQRKTGAWAPDIVEGEEGEQEATNAAFRARWREQLWGQGGVRENIW